MKTDARVNLKIEEPEGGKGPAHARTADATHDEVVEEPTEGMPHHTSSATDEIDEAIDDLKI